MKGSGFDGKGYHRGYYTGEHPFITVTLGFCEGRWSHSSLGFKVQGSGC